MIGDDVPGPAACDVGPLARKARRPLDQVPHLHEVVVQDQTQPLSRSQEEEVTAVLGVGAKVARTAVVARFTPAQRWV